MKERIMALLVSFRDRSATAATSALEIGFSNPSRTRSSASTKAVTSHRTPKLFHHRTILRPGADGDVGFVYFHFQSVQAAVASQIVRNETQPVLVAQLLGYQDKRLL